MDRLEIASFLRSNGTFQYLTGIESFPDPQTLRRFLLQAPVGLWERLHGVNDRLRQNFMHLPDHCSRLILDLDSTVVTSLGHQDGAEVGYNPRYRGKRSYNPLLCIEANSSYLWDVELRAGNAGTWEGSVELLDTSFANVPPDIREIRVRADAGFAFNPVLDALESQPARYAVVARLTRPFRNLLPGLRYAPVNRYWEMAEFEHRSHGWCKARRCVVARRCLPDEEGQPTLFTLGRYVYRAWRTDLRSLPLASGISTTAARPWNGTSGNCARTSCCRKSPLVPLPLMPSIWRSFAWPTTSSPHSCEPARSPIGNPSHCRYSASTFS